jgi:MFS family permease
MVPLVPWVAQRLGRRWSIFLGSLLQCGGALIQGFSVHGEYSENLTCSCVQLLRDISVGMYIVARMILGSGIIFCIVSGSAMLGELSYPKERPTMTSMFNASYFVGSLIASGIVVRTAKIPNDWGWRIPSLLQCAPSMIQMALVLYIPLLLPSFSSLTNPTASSPNPQDISSPKIDTPKLSKS